ncbi:FAD-dependent monooxygenase [Saccharothrix deserti]|uniref:FAD-dependent monooxygenase n=1 Tax=Saccharothrix deserti TaxID=2593674 RepID=UPI00131EADCC|nr:FAD-dependent monooxygenase [Saccharothrix deserti]
MDKHIDVLVVGAGPTGLTLACDLRRRGISFRVVNAADHGFEGSRAKGVQPRTLEVLDDLGVLPELRPRGSRYPLLGLHIGPFTLPWVMYKHHKPTENVPHPDTMLVPQYETDASLRRRLAELGATVEDGTRLVSFEEDSDGIIATLEEPGGTELVRTRFLVGTDGGSSAVRRAAGIDFVGSTDENDRAIVADVDLSGLSRNRWHVWPRKAGRFMALCPLPDGDKFQLMLKLRPDEEADLGQEAVDRLVQEVVGRPGLQVHEIHWASVWNPNTRLAERYRSGNVFLAGDAAHVHPPAGAQGLNTGVQDAYNLGWKLAQVLAGAPDALLDSYEAERQPIAARVLGLSSELYAGVSNRHLTAVKRGDEERQLALTYRGGPLAPDSDPQQKGVRAGDRAPDARYTDTRGRSGRLFDVFRRPHFTLLAVRQPAIDALDLVNWPDRGARLETVAIPAGAAPGLKRAYGIQGSAQILVRPDGYVAHVAQDNWAESLHEHSRLMLPRFAG